MFRSTQALLVGPPAPRAAPPSASWPTTRARWMRAVACSVVAWFFAGKAAAGIVASDRKTVEAELSQVSAAAKKEFPKFLSAAWSSKEEYGFRHEDKKESVSLAKPIRVYGIDEESAARTGPEHSALDVLDFVGEWIFPVQVDDQYRTLFGVRWRDGEWRGTYLGNPYLAKNLESIRRIWSFAGEDGFRLVSCVQPRSFFYTVDRAAFPNLTPMTPIALGGPNALSPPRDWRNVIASRDTIDALLQLWRQQHAEQGTMPDNGKED